jgi:hypothetical protein
LWHATTLAFRQFLRQSIWWFLFSKRWLLASLEGSRSSLSVAIDHVDQAAIGALFFQPVSKQQQHTFKGVVWHIFDRKHSSADWAFAMVGCWENGHHW